MNWFELMCDLLFKPFHEDLKACNGTATSVVPRIAWCPWLQWFCYPPGTSKRFPRFRHRRRSKCERNGGSDPVDVWNGSIVNYYAATSIWMYLMNIGEPLNDFVLNMFQFFPHFFLSLTGFWQTYHISIMNFHVDEFFGSPLRSMEQAPFCRCHGLWNGGSLVKSSDASLGVGRAFQRWLKKVYINYIYHICILYTCVYYMSILIPLLNGRVRWNPFVPAYFQVRKSKLPPFLVVAGALTFISILSAPPSHTWQNAKMLSMFSCRLSSILRLKK